MGQSVVFLLKDFLGQIVFSASMADPESGNLVESGSVFPLKGLDPVPYIHPIYYIMNCLEFLTLNINMFKRLDPGPVFLKDPDP